MTTGAIIGGVVGAVIGFFIGGPIGAVWGAAIGAGIGMGVEAMTADVPSPGEPELGELSVNMAKEGALIPDILGSPKLNANILWSYGNRVEEVTEKQEGKGGGGAEVVTGYKYFLTWIVGVCVGPVDTLYTIYKNDEVVWHGSLSCPVSGGKEKITLDGMGSADFYFGTNDHAQNSYIGSRLDDPTLNVPYRNLCWMLLKDCYIGDYNRAPSMHFVIHKTPDIVALTIGDKDIETYDYNAIHAIYYVLNTMSGLPTTWLHADSFKEAAATLKAESRGLTIQFNRQAMAQSYIETILQHIGGILRYSGDSKLHLKLWRDTELLSSIPTIDEDSLLEAPTIDRKSWIDTLNEVRVQHTNRFFRDLTCPSGCDGFEGDVSQIEGGEKRTYTIKNLAWDELAEYCSDLSFLSDGLPAGKQGTFDNLQKISKGEWSFDYTAHADLCLGQDPSDPEYCPIICGVYLSCCGCGAIPDLDWDDELSAETIAKSSQVNIYVEDGQGPYDWEITIGTGFSLGSSQTSGVSNVLYADGDACGSCKIKVTDVCKDEVFGYVRCTTGQWTEITFSSCIISGAITEGDGSNTRIQGMWKLTEVWIVPCAGGDCEDICGDLPVQCHCLTSAKCHDVMGCTQCLDHGGICNRPTHLVNCVVGDCLCCGEEDCDSGDGAVMCSDDDSKLYRWMC